MDELDKHGMLTSDEEEAFVIVKAIIEGRTAKRISPVGCPDNEAFRAGASPSSVQSLIKHGVLRTKRFLNGNLLFIA